MLGEVWVSRVLSFGITCCKWSHTSGTKNITRVYVLLGKCFFFGMARDPLNAAGKSFWEYLLFMDLDPFTYRCYRILIKCLG